MTEPFDLIVIGGGRASTLAIAAAKAGKKTANWILVSAHPERIDAFSNRFNTG